MLFLWDRDESINCNELMLKCFIHADTQEMDWVLVVEKFFL